MSMSNRLVASVEQLLSAFQVLLVGLSCWMILHVSPIKGGAVAIGVLLFLVGAGTVWRMWRQGFFLMTPAQLRGKISVNFLESAAICFGVVASIVAVFRP
jgi:hypothetical protein